MYCFPTQTYSILMPHLESVILHRNCRTFMETSCCISLSFILVVTLCQVVLCAVNESIYNGPSVCKAEMCCFESWGFWCLILCIICLISCVDKIDECRSLVGRPIPSLLHSSTKVLFFEAAIQTLGGFVLFKEERTDEKGAGQVAAISNCSGYRPEFAWLCCNVCILKATSHNPTQTNSISCCECHTFCFRYSCPHCAGRISHSLNKNGRGMTI